jgi:hypothetical protein
MFLLNLPARKESRIRSTEIGPLPSSEASRYRPHIVDKAESIFRYPKNSLCGRALSAAHP